MSSSGSLVVIRGEGRLIKMPALIALITKKRVVDRHNKAPCFHIGRRNAPKYFQKSRKERKKEKKTGQTERQKMRKKGRENDPKERVPKQKQKWLLEAEPVSESSEWIGYRVNSSSAPSERMP